MHTTTEIRPLHQDRLQEFAGRVMDDIGGAFAVLLSFIGDRTGAYRVPAFVRWPAIYPAGATITPL